MKIKELINLLRINQWYKNLVIYLALVFSNLLFDKQLFLLTTLGFFSLCLISSGNYIINDIIDRKKDLEHPEKKLRPIASNKISLTEGIFLTAILIFFSFTIAYLISLQFYYL